MKLVITEATLVETPFPGGPHTLTVRAEGEEAPVAVTAHFDVRRDEADWLQGYDRCYWVSGTDFTLEDYLDVPVPQVPAVEDLLAIMRAYFSLSEHEVTGVRESMQGLKVTGEVE